jgi:hypothetical protein
MRPIAHFEYDAIWTHDAPVRQCVLFDAGVIGVARGARPRFQPHKGTR